MFSNDVFASCASDVRSLVLLRDPRKIKSISSFSALFFVIIDCSDVKNAVLIPAF